MLKVGEEISEYVDYTQASSVMKRIIRPKYAPKHGEGAFAIAEVTSRALPKSMVSESFIAWLVVSEFVGHMPFYRQRQSIKR